MVSKERKRMFYWRGLEMWEECWRVFCSDKKIVGEVLFRKKIVIFWVIWFVCGIKVVSDKWYLSCKCGVVFFLCCKNLNFF